MKGISLINKPPISFNKNNWFQLVTSVETVATTVLPKLQ